MGRTREAYHGVLVDMALFSWTKIYFNGGHHLLGSSQRARWRSQTHTLLVPFFCHMVFFLAVDTTLIPLCYDT
jgi:hypothetical protein